MWLTCAQKQGGVIVGDASQMIQIFDISRLVEHFDVGIGKFIGEGRRRRLMQEGGGKSTGGSEGGSSIMGHLTGHMKNGGKAFMSLTKMISAVASGSLFAGADMGMLLSSQDPHVKLIGSALSAPVMAWAQFTYEAAVPMIIDILASLKKVYYIILTIDFFCLVYLIFFFFDTGRIVMGSFMAPYP